MSSHILSQCHDPNQPHILGPIITGSLTDDGSLWPCDQRAHGLAICHREGEVRRPRHPETLWLGPDPKNGQWTHPDPATVADTLRGCTAWGSDVDTLTASVSRSTQEHTALLSAYTHGLMHSPTHKCHMVPMQYRLCPGSWLTWTLMEGAGGRNMGNREMRCGDTGGKTPLEQV